MPCISHWNFFSTSLCAPPCFQLPPSLLCSQCFHCSSPSVSLTSCQPGRRWPKQADLVVYTCCWVSSATNLISRGVQAVCPGNGSRPPVTGQGLTAGKQLENSSEWSASVHNTLLCETLCCSSFCAQFCWFRTSLVVENQCVQQISAFVFSSHLQLSLQAAKSRNCTSGFLRNCTKFPI